MTRAPILRALTLAAIVGACAASSAALPDPALGPPAHWAGLEEHALVSVPAGGGPFPVVIFLHGCSRPHTNAAAYVARAHEAGVAAIVIDSFGPRGLSPAAAARSVCLALRLRPQARAADLLAALDHVASDPRLDADRVALAGWSHGAWTVMDTLAGLDPARSPAAAWDATARLGDIRGAFLLYPYCGVFSASKAAGWREPVPAEFILVEGDQVTKVGPCLHTIEVLEAQGVDARVTMVAGVTHGFDEQFHAPRGWLDVRADLRADPDATEHALDLFSAFLDRMFSPTVAD